ncbi:ATP synthase subunit B [Trema orientale]|uniref:ATP synthase subunit B n=1 Tax=Trema orientale TaxID=63057 RepID=A0A2P5EZF5_TREOI|nr:ATP synthase subunit B [Trema orientale]
MESLRKLEELQKTIMLMQSYGVVSSSSSSDHDSNRFIASLVLFLIQPCGELDLAKKCALVSDYVPKISSGFLQKASICLSQKGSQQHNVGEEFQINCVDKSDSYLLHSDFEEMAMIGLDSMQRANSTLEDFCRSYFMFHGMDVNKPNEIFKYLPLLSFTESYIYQLDSLNEKTLHAPRNGEKFLERGAKEVEPMFISKFTNVFKTDPFRPLADLLGYHGLLTERMREEFKHGEEYWALERMLCCALVNRKEISVEDVIKAIHLKSFDYRVLNLLLYQLRGEQVNEVHMDFLSISEFLVEVADDLFDYEDDVLENNFNILRMFVRIYGTSAPAMVAKYIAQAEEKYSILLKTLESQLSLEYHRRCEEATREGNVTI